MNSIKTIVLAGLLLILNGVGVSAQEWTFSRYQPILDRQPFGRPPPPPQPPQPPPQPAAPPKIPFTQSLRLSSLTYRHGEYRAGIVDISGKTGQEFYYLFLGETDGGLSFIDIDPAGEKVRLEMDGEKEWLSMSISGEDTAQSPTGRQAAPVVRTAAVQASPAVSSYRERLAARHEARQRRLEQERERVQQMTQEQVERQLQEYQMELIRAEGEAGPPIPGVKLTPDMDKQLVEEGVLPPLLSPDEENPE